MRTVTRIPRMHAFPPITSGLCAIRSKSATIQFLFPWRACAGFSGRGRRICPEPVDVVRPLLHHLSSFSQSLRTVVSRSHSVPLSMRKLQLDEIRVHALFVEQSASHAPEPVRGHLRPRVPQATDCAVQRVLAERSPSPTNRGKDIPLAPRNRL